MCRIMLICVCEALFSKLVSLPFQVSQEAKADKKDHYPTGRALDLDLTIQGAPNFRAPDEESLNVYGVGRHDLYAEDSANETGRATHDHRSTIHSHDSWMSSDSSSFPLYTPRVGCNWKRIPAGEGSESPAGIGFEQRVRD